MAMPFNRTILRAAAVIASAFALLSSAQALEIDAGDYTAAPPGTDVGLLYLQHATRDGIYHKGSRVAEGGLDSTIGILRGVHFTDIGGLTVDPQFLLPFGRLEGRGATAGLGSTSGMADAILAATVWLQNDPANKQWTGVTPFVYVPTGKYDRNAALNLGENRWRYTFQATHIRPLASNVTVDLSADFTLYGANKDFGPNGQTMKQDPLVQTQAWLRYHFSPTTDLRLQLSHAFGGETKVDGVAQDNRQATTKFLAGGSFFVGPKTQIVALMGKDIKTREGFKESGRVNIRVLQLF